jgi:protein-L-isoaspartate O-methyltransferase
MDEEPFQAWRDEDEDEDEDEEDEEVRSGASRARARPAFALELLPARAPAHPPPYTLRPGLSRTQFVEELEAAQRRAAARPAARVPLQHFLRLLAGGGALVEMADPRGGGAASNDELIELLRRGGALTSDAVARAMRLAPRDAFVPPAHVAEALMDVPIRVDAENFNISAPHMHAACLEALDLRPGHAVLDAGAGCGLVAAAAAALVGRTGAVLGLDVRRGAVALARASCARLAAASPEWRAAAGGAGQLAFEQGDVFLLAVGRLRGRFDRVHVGGCVPASRLPALLALLKPEGGAIVVPVAPSDLRLVRRDAEGTVTQRVLSQVRFSELEVPGDADVVLAALKEARRAGTAPPPAPSTFERDAAAVAAEAARKPPPPPPSTSPAGVLGGPPGTPDAAAAARAAAGPLAPARLGEPDALLVGAGFALPAHAAVLRARCELLRARADSGMADACAARVAVPEHFSEAAAAALLDYCYSDACPERVERASGGDLAAAVEVLELAQYFGSPRLATLSEAALARALKAAGRSPAAAAAAADAGAQLLAFALDQGLVHLRAVALDFCVENFTAVAAGEAWTALPRGAVEAVAAEACARNARARSLLREMSAAAREELPDP